MFFFILDKRSIEMATDRLICVMCVRTVVLKLGVLLAQKSRYEIGLLTKKIPHFNVPSYLFLLFGVSTFLQSQKSVPKIPHHLCGRLF